MNILLEKLKSSVSSTGKNYILVLGLVGILFLSLGELMPETNAKEHKAESYENYKTDIEQQLVRILSSIKGAGDVEVMLTLESGQETIYVQQEKKVKDEEISQGNDDTNQSIRDSYENEIVMIEENNQKQALVEKIMEPVVQGVVVVSSGADDISVVSDITNAVCVALNITSNRVCVIKMK